MSEREIEVLGDDLERLRAAGIDTAPVAAAVRAVAGCLGAGGTLITLGNGGSAADAQHVAAEFVGRFEAPGRPGWPALALTADSSALTAIANDFGFEQVFSRQLQALGRRGDVVLAISTSGDSPNVLAAVAEARRGGIITVGLCGEGDSGLSRQADIAIATPGTGSAAIQEHHLLVEHCLCRAVEASLLANGGFHAPGSVLALEPLLALREGWGAGRRVVVWTNGCFDLLHRGHLHSLEAARALGDILVVGVNGDASVHRLKGEGRPLMPAGERAELLAGLRVVDYVTVFEDDTPAAVLEALRPDIHTKGADYAPPDGKPVPERAIVEAYGGRVEFLPLIPGLSSTTLVSAMLDGDGDGEAGGVPTPPLVADAAG